MFFFRRALGDGERELIQELGRPFAVQIPQFRLDLGDAITTNYGNIKKQELILDNEASVHTTNDFRFLSGTEKVSGVCFQDDGKGSNIKKKVSVFIFIMC
ncbi:hypothetical protein PsorP6_014385 [Peronosclerospora sorghi]|uniref:Uncharacterized protein n=1 Tax=Peronosclerospora sorghi TaxID=230839 RepID=A0ACC0VKF2_9STRA|nr:hypothetical protein PsorP6_014385 [Peronosclerospora sorghi]